jgi:tetratricopeptide (TPR) repeat protein
MVSDDLVPRIEMLTDMIMQLSLPQTPGDPQEKTQSQANISVPKMQPSIAKLVISAKDILYEANSIVAQSEGGSDASSTITTVLRNLDFHKQDFEESATISPRRKPVRAGADFERIIQDWIPTASSGASTSHFGSASQTTRTQMTPSQSSFGMSALGDECQETTGGPDSDSDDELEYEILQGYLDKGFLLYKDCQWEKAELYIRRAIDVSKVVPLDKVRNKGIDLEEVQFKVAVCALHQKKLEEADVDLLHLRTVRPAPDEHKNTTLRRILSVYLFAWICLEKTKLEEAQKYCRKALSMKRKRFGEMAWLEADIFSLLSAISKAQGDDLTAEVYQDKANQSAAVPSPEPSEPEIQFVRLDMLRDMRGLPDEPEVELQVVTKLVSLLFEVLGGANRRI